MDLLGNTDYSLFDYSNNLGKARHASDKYKELENQPAWRDFVGQIKQTRAALVNQILTPGGTVDKWGKTHEEEKKAILVFIDTLLGHTIGVHGRVEQLEAIKKQQDEQKARAAYVPTGQIHGQDSMFDDVL